MFGSSSRVTDIDAWNDEAFPRYRRSVPARLEAILEPGERLATAKNNNCSNIVAIQLSEAGDDPGARLGCTSAPFVCMRVLLRLHMQVRNRVV